MLKILLRPDFWIYCVMAIIFISGLILCILPVKKIQRALKRAGRELSGRRRDGSYVYDHPAFLGCKLVDDCWARFISNLKTMRKNNSVCEIEDFINPQSMIHGPGHSVFGEMIPGVLTTLGIVGSFYGIVKGLSTLNLETSETMSLSIVVLISGMRTAFNTSIVGAVLALTFQLLRRATIGSAENTLNNFVRNCQTEMAAMLTPDASLMQTLYAILSELRNMNRYGQSPSSRL